MRKARGGPSLKRLLIIVALVPTGLYWGAVFALDSMHM